MKLSEMRTHDEVSADRRGEDPAYADEADLMALAGELSVALVAYRTASELTQSQLATRLGWKQPMVARLEAGDHVPSLPTLERLARAGVVRVRLGQGEARVEPGIAV